MRSTLSLRSFSKKVNSQQVPVLSLPRLETMILYLGDTTDAIS